MHFSRNLVSSIRPIGAFCALLAGVLSTPQSTRAHGFAGQRFFPATLTTEDPFVADELSLPTLSTIHTDDAGGTREFTASIDIAKRITPNLAVEIGLEQVNLFPDHGSRKSGFNNLELGAKYQLFTSDAHEFIFSVGGEVEIGGTGSRKIGREAYSTWSTAVYFGKGFGDLPANLGWLRPFALTGSIGVDIPSSASSRSTGEADPVTGDREIEVERNPVSLETNFALQYSLIYLQEHVKDIGLGAPFNRLIPLVEFVIDTPLNRGQSGLTTGTVNPGMIWSGRFCQIGIEALIPINERSGHNVGVLGQLHFYLDDLFPHSLGKPLFGSRDRTTSSAASNLAK